MNNIIQLSKQFSYLEKISKIKKTKENIIKIANFICKNFIHSDHFFEYKTHPFEALNIYKLIEVYGFGNCKYNSILFKFFMDAIGVKCFIFYGEYGLDKKGKKQNHCYNVIELNNEKFLIDTDFGLITYNNNLIKYNQKLDLKMFLNFFIKKKVIYASKNFSFAKVYYHKHSENFNITEKLFDYKLQMRKYFSELYYFNIPIFNKNFKGKKIKKKMIILNNKRKNLIGKQDKKNELKSGVIEFYSTKFKVNGNNFNLNDFPYLIVDLKVTPLNSVKKENFIFTYNDKKTNFKYNQYIFKNRNYTSPIYSFSIKSKKKIKNIEIIYQKSLFKKKLIKFLNQLVKN